MKINTEELSNEDIEMLHEIGRKLDLLQTIYSTPCPHTPHPAVVTPPTDNDVDKWLQGGKWPLVPAAIAALLLLLLISVGCSGLQKAPCRWKTRISHGKLTAEAVCDADLGGIRLPVSGTVRCTATLDLPHHQTRTAL